MGESVDARGLPDKGPRANAGPAEVAAPDDAELMRRKRLYDELHAHRDHVHAWNGLEHVGTIAAVIGGEAFLHRGRHEYVRLDIARDLHGIAPTAGAFVSLARDGTFSQAEEASRHATHERER